MRLLECCGDGKFKLTKDLVGVLPRYAILSHTWGPDTEEVTFRDLEDGTGEDKAGYKKIKFCGAQARRDGLQYFWVDTCCIDKSNNNELAEAINSMFRWYHDAARCYVYLPDVLTPDHENDSQQSKPVWESAFRASRYFTRGWTLQELLAPPSVEFFAQDGRRLGDKRSLEQQIHEITGIAVAALQGNPLPQFDVEERFRWAATRQTTRGEDWAYSLLGIFGVFMPLIYGEGKENAIRRLKKAIFDARNHEDTSNRLEVKNRTWMVPFERNPSFTGRQSELNKLQNMLLTGRQTVKVAITGLGGVGKTQLALELVYRIRDEDENCSIIWMPATNKESLEQAYLTAAKQLGISGHGDEKADVKRLVQDYLGSEDAGRWLLVFDNADDIDMWIETSTQKTKRLIDYLPQISFGSPQKTKHLIDYLPQSSLGSIIFTTRDRKAAVTLANRNIVETLEVDQVGGKKLLQEYLLDQTLLDNKEDTTALLARLTYLPLAIVQAAVYVNKNGICLGDYLSLLDEQEEDVIDLLSEDFEDEGRYRGLNNPVATTWLISFEQMRLRDRLAGDYLSFMACVDSRDIPISLLPPGQSRKKETDAMGTLQGYSFVTKRSADLAIDIHRLVHLATRNWLRKEGLLSQWTSRVILRLGQVMADSDNHNREVWRSYLPHAYNALRLGINSEADRNRIYLLSRYGACLNYDGRYQEAAVQFEQVMEFLKTRHRPNHEDVLATMESLAITYTNQGRWEEAEKLQLKVMETRKTKLGPDHRDTLAGINNLASTYWNQGRWEEAEKLNVQVMETSKSKLGPDHPETLRSMNNLATTYEGQGRWEEAEKLHIQVTETSKRTLGPDHLDTLSSMNNQALTYKSQDRLEEAEKLHSEVLEMRKIKVGPDHPDTLASMNNLATTYWAQGRLEEAEKLQAQAMEAIHTKLGPNHPHTLMIMHNLAIMWEGLDRRSDALALIIKCAETRKRVLGPKHPDTLSSLEGVESYSS